MKMYLISDNKDTYTGMRLAGVEGVVVHERQELKEALDAVFQDKESLVFGISISGEKEEVLYLLRKAHRRGAKTVLLTAKNKGIFEEFCDEIVLLPSLRHLNHGNVISPQFPILVMLDIIYSYYVEQDKFAKELLHDNTLRALEEGEHKRREVIE